VPKLAIPLPPQIESRSRNIEASAGLVDVPDPFGVLNDSLLSMHLSLFVGHSDLLGVIYSEDGRMVRLDL
jgi:hypothetical protein